MIFRVNKATVDFFVQIDGFCLPRWDRGFEPRLALFFMPQNPHRYVGFEVFCSMDTSRKLVDPVAPSTCVNGLNTPLSVYPFNNCKNSII